MSSSQVPVIELKYDKYTLAGNTFLIVDESRTPLSDDRARSGFARWALDGYFGIGGADNVLFICATPQENTYTFRIFEHDGTETLSCGNGLLAAGDFISRRSSEKSWTVLTEAPTGRLRAVRVATGSGTGLISVDIGPARPIPPELYRRTGAMPTDAVETLTIEVPVPHGSAGSGAHTRPQRVEGRLVFTGEPHLVFVCGHGAPDMRTTLFPATQTRESLALFDDLGREVNSRYRDLFPRGVHVNVVDRSDHALRCRTWERAIDKETLACGTGALACAHVCRSLGLVHEEAATVLPHRAGWHRPGVELLVTTRAHGALTLQGRPLLACSGTIPAEAMTP